VVSNQISVLTPSATATFVKTDSTTQGTWKSVYGANGSAIANDSANYPAYAQVTVNNTGTYTWSASTAGVRALQKYATADRIASTWYSPSSFNIDVNITDGNTHQVALYSLDRENAGRSERIDVLDTTSGNVWTAVRYRAFRAASTWCGPTGIWESGSVTLVVHVFSTREVGRWRVINGAGSALFVGRCDGSERRPWRQSIGANAGLRGCLDQPGEAHNLSSELIIVEWNPPAGRDRLAKALRWPSDTGPCEVRIIEVPPEVHARYRQAAALPLYQMIAKNVGIRRARGEFILSTNIDIVFSANWSGFWHRGGWKEAACTGSTGTMS
jgi:S-adenosylmethionine hydrolase